MISIKNKIKKSFDALKEKFGYKNVMQSPKILKVIISSGVGSFKDKKKNEIVIDRLSKITGQKISGRGAKKSVASFKVREGDIVGFQATLRGQKMIDFLDRLINIALPRTKDFKWLSLSSIDDAGNYTFGIKEHSIFPETADEDIKDIFGMAITVVTNKKDKNEVIEFMRYVGFPLKKQTQT